MNENVYLEKLAQQDIADFLSPLFTVKNWEAIFKTLRSLKYWEAKFYYGMGDQLYSEFRQAIQLHIQTLGSERGYITQDEAVEILQNTNIENFDELTGLSMLSEFLGQNLDFLKSEQHFRRTLIQQIDLLEPNHPLKSILGKTSNFVVERFLSRKEWWGNFSKKHPLGANKQNIKIDNDKILFVDMTSTGETAIAATQKQWYLVDLESRAVKFSVENAQFAEPLSFRKWLSAVDNANGDFESLNYHVTAWNNEKVCSDIQKIWDSEIDLSQCTKAPNTINMSKVFNWYVENGLGQYRSAVSIFDAYWDYSIQYEVGRPNSGSDITSAHISESSTFVYTTSEDGFARIWDLKSGSLLQSLFHEDRYEQVTSIDFHTMTNCWLTATADRTNEIFCGLLRAN